MSENNNEEIKDDIQRANIKERKLLYWIIVILSFFIIFSLSMRILLSYFSYNENHFPLGKWFYFPSVVTYNIFDLPPKYLHNGNDGPNSDIDYYNATDSLMYHYRSKTIWHYKNDSVFIKTHKSYFPNDSLDKRFFIECELYTDKLLNKKESKNKYLTSFINQYISITKNFFIILIGIISILLALLIGRIYKSRSKTIRYVICPYCSKSVLTYYNWRCDHCNYQQGEEKYIYDPCNQCGRKIETLICEHCEKEFKF